MAQRIRKNASLKTVATTAVLRANRARAKYIRNIEGSIEARTRYGAGGSYADFQHAQTHASLALVAWRDVAEIAAHLARLAGVTAPEEWKLALR